MKTYRTTKIICESRKGHACKWGGWLINVPFIRVRGRWLEEAGFNIGDNLRIKVESGKLTLTKDS